MNLLNLNKRFWTTLFFVSAVTFSYAQYASLNWIISLGKSKIVEVADMGLKANKYVCTGSCVDNSAYPTLNVYYYCKNCNVNNNGDVISTDGQKWSYFELSFNVPETYTYQVQYYFGSRTMYEKYINEAKNNDFVFSLSKTYNDHVAKYYKKGTQILAFVEFTSGKHCISFMDAKNIKQ